MTRIVNILALCLSSTVFSAAVTFAEDAPIKLPDLPSGSADLTKQAPAVGTEVKTPVLPAADNTTKTNPATNTGTNTSPASEPVNKPEKHVIVKGDTYWALSYKYYGAGKDWEKIAKANAFKPHALKIGAELEIPAK